MKYFRLLPVVVMAAVSACEPLPETFSLNEADNTKLIGVWSGIEEMTTAEDLGSNTNFPGTPGFSFPVIITFDANNRFTLVTSNFPTSYRYEEDRTCSGVYSRSGYMISFFPTQLCRALPMSKFTIGRELSGGISFDARSNMSTSSMANYTSMYVRFNLVRE